MTQPSLLHALRILVDPRFAFSTGLELASIASGFTQQLGPNEAAVATTVESGVDVYYQDTFPLEDRGRQRWRLDPRGLETVDTYGFHTSGVDGGFGVAKYQWTPWLKTWDQLVKHEQALNHDPPSERHSGLVPWVPDGMDLEDARLAWAKLMALRTRYRGLPYHSISSVPSLELVINHLLQTYTNHGNRMNRYTWGHAMDDVWSDDEDVSTERVDHELAVLDRVHRHVFDHSGRPHACECHSQHAAKPHDPGKQYLERVIVPFARDKKLIIRADVRTGNGSHLRI